MASVLATRVYRIWWSTPTILVFRLTDCFRIRHIPRVGNLPRLGLLLLPTRCEEAWLARLRILPLPNYWTGDGAVVEESDWQKSRGLERACVDDALDLGFRSTRQCVPLSDHASRLLRLHLTGLFQLTRSIRLGFIMAIPFRLRTA